MLCNNPKLDHVNSNAHTNLDKFYKRVLKILSGNKKIMTNERTDGQTNEKTE